METFAVSMAESFDMSFDTPTTRATQGACSATDGETG
jgi:hypothetical protein